jgi:hypothetical protein
MDTIELLLETVFLLAPCKEVIKKRTGATSSVELCKRGWKEMAI